MIRLLVLKHSTKNGPPGFLKEQLKLLADWDNDHVVVDDSI